MRVATVILLALVLLTLVYIAVILKKNLANQASPSDMKDFFKSMIKEVPAQVQSGINNVFTPTPSNIGVSKYVS